MKVNKEKLHSLAKEENAEERALAHDFRENRNLYKASMRIAMKIKRALREKGMTQCQLAREMNMDTATISRYLNGKANMELKTMLRFEEKLGVNIIDRSISPYSNERGEAKMKEIINFCAKTPASISSERVNIHEGYYITAIYDAISLPNTYLQYYNSSSPQIAGDPGSAYGPLE